MSEGTFKLVYVISERSGRKFWNRIGAAFVNSDGSLNVRLDAVPVTGDMHIRDYQPRDNEGPRSGRDTTEDVAV